MGMRKWVQYIHSLDCADGFSVYTHVICYIQLPLFGKQILFLVKLDLGEVKLQ